MSQNLSMRSATSFGNHIMRIQNKTSTALAADYGASTNSGYDCSTINMTPRLSSHKDNISTNCLNTTLTSKSGINYRHNKLKMKMFETQDDEASQPMKSNYIFDMSSNTLKENGRGNNQERGIVMKSRARCRSAPVNRIRMLPKNERGVTTSSQTTTSILKNKIILPPKKPAPVVSFPRKISATVHQLSLSEKRSQGKMAPSLRKMSAPPVSRSSLLASSRKKANNCSFTDGGMLTDLKIKTFHFQLEYEKGLKEK